MALKTLGKLVWFWVKIILGVLLFATLAQTVYQYASSMSTVRIVVADGFAQRASEILNPPAEDKDSSLENFFTRDFIASDRMIYDNPFASEAIKSYNYRFNIEAIRVDPFRDRAYLTATESVTGIEGFHEKDEDSEQPSSSEQLLEDYWPPRRYKITCVKTGGNWYVQSIDSDEILPVQSTPTPEPTITARPTRTPLPTPDPTYDPHGSPTAGPDETPEPFEYGVITATSANVRNGPGTRYAKITEYLTGERVIILGEENNWYHIRSLDGTVEGYISKKLVRKE